MKSLELFHNVKNRVENTVWSYSIGKLLFLILLFPINDLALIKTIWHDSIMYIYVRVENLYIPKFFERC